MFKNIPGWKQSTHTRTHSTELVVRKEGNLSLTSGMSLEDVLSFCSVVRNGVATLWQPLTLELILYTFKQK